MTTQIKTVSDQFEVTKGRPSGFDYLRIFLSVAVIGYHTIVVCYGKDADTILWKGGNPFRPLLCLIIPAFFALSGFLISGSLFRNSIPAFLALRVSRIFPALVCEVLISALIIGPLLTAYTLEHYFSDSQLYHYFLNILGDIHYNLPGLFLSNPYPANVNGQLWTIPYELQCYIAITMLALFKVVDKRRLFILVFIAATLFAFCYSQFITGFDQEHWGPSGRTCVLSFLAGIMVYLWRDKLPYSATWMALATITAMFLLRQVETEYFAAFPVAYLTVWLGLQNPKKNIIIAGADYSYGMYLYGYPIQQAVAQVVPGGRMWFVNLVVTVAVSGVAAWCSWHLLEKHVLANKKIAVNFAEKFVGGGAKAIHSTLPSVCHKLWAALMGLGEATDCYLQRFGRPALTAEASSKE
jgi:peptidoglycan/LPS O-acetylase OafA/YrhL